VRHTKVLKRSGPTIRREKIFSLTKMNIKITSLLA
jgi:hypothetical protein